METHEEDRLRGIRAASAELARRSNRWPAATVLFGPAAVVVIVMLALEAWPALREKSDLFWGLVGTGAIAIWFFGRLGYFALVGIPVDGDGSRTRRVWWLEVILTVAGLVLAVAAFMVLGLAFG